jgi:hypothetical protein
MLPKPSYEFLSLHANLSWRDVLFGIKKGLVSEEVAIDKALVEIGISSDAPADVAMLASEHDLFRTLEIVDRLATAEVSISSALIQQKWLYLHLAWLYQIRDLVDDPFGDVESAYADFGYPEEMACFVRYMPMVGSDLGSREKNLDRLYGNWRAYIQTSRKVYFV